MSMARMNLKGKQTKNKCDSSPDNPPQLNHHRWKKHTMYPNYISDNLKQSTIAEQSYGTHMWQYISNMGGMFKYIGDTNCNESWWMHFVVYLFFRCTFLNMSPNHFSVHSWRSIRTHYASCLFAKKNVVMLFVCYVQVFDCSSCNSVLWCVFEYFLFHVNTTLCIFFMIFFLSFACILSMLFICKFLLKYCLWGF